MAFDFDGLGRQTMSNVSLVSDRGGDVLVAPILESIRRRVGSLDRYMIDKLSFTRSLNMARDLDSANVGSLGLRELIEAGEKQTPTLLIKFKSKRFYSPAREADQRRQPLAPVNFLSPERRARPCTASNSPGA